MPRLAFMFAAQAFFLWMFLSTEGLERLADAGQLAGAAPGALTPVAYRYAAEWRHGLAGFWPVYVPGFFAAAIAAWFWSFGRPLRRLLPEGFAIMAAALAVAAALAPAGAILVLRDFARETGITALAPVPGPGARGIAMGFYTLLAWNAVVLSCHRALWCRSFKPLLVPVAFDAVLVFVRPFTFDDLVSLWVRRAFSGNLLAAAWLAAVPAVAVLLAWRQLAWERARSAAAVATAACLLLLALPASAAAAPPEIRHAAALVRSVPESGTQYDYTVAAAVRLGFFWISRHDVGSASIRTGTDAAGNRHIRLVIGSDPRKAPFGVNRWGAAAEVMEPSGAVAFFGLMKPNARTGSPAAARSDAAADARRPRLQGLIARTSPQGAVSAGAILPVPADFTVSQFAAAGDAVLDRLASQPPRTVTAADMQRCARCAGFLFSVQELIAEALAGGPAPVHRCFWYNGRLYALILARHEKGRDFRQAWFEVARDGTRGRSAFRMLIDAAGIPLEIEYRPNWWFRIVLKLAGQPPASRGGS